MGQRRAPQLTSALSTKNIFWGVKRVFKNTGGGPEETVDLTVDVTTTNGDPGPSRSNTTPVQELDDESDDEMVLRLPSGYPFQ